MIRTVIEKACAMIHGAQLDKSFWDDAVLHGVKKQADSIWLSHNY